MAQQQNLADALSCRLCDWQELATALPAAQRFNSIVVVDPVTVCGIRDTLLPTFFELMASRLSAGGRVAVLAFFAAPALAAVERRSSSFFKNEVLRGADLPTREEFLASAQCAGLAAAPAESGDGRADVGGLAGDYAATMRQWRLQLAHAWNACTNTGTTDAQLRQCVAPCCRCLPRVCAGATNVDAASVSVATTLRCSAVERSPIGALEHGYASPRGPEVQVGD